MICQDAVILSISEQFSVLYDSLYSKKKRLGYQYFMFH